MGKETKSRGCVIPLLVWTRQSTAGLGSSKNTPSPQQFILGPPRTLKGVKPGSLLGQGVLG